MQTDLIVIFDWDKLLNFDGETGPYVQYTYARAASVIRKIGEVPAVYDYSVLSDDASMALLKEIAKDKLVIMVTHNPELAEEYSTRIVRLFKYWKEHLYIRYYKSRDNEFIKQSESALIQAILPPFNTDLTEYKVKEPIKAF